jgi:hypothetical protein
MCSSMKVEIDIEFLRLARHFQRRNELRVLRDTMALCELMGALSDPIENERL